MIMKHRESTCGYESAVDVSKQNMVDTDFVGKPGFLAFRGSTHIHLPFPSRGFPAMIEGTKTELPLVVHLVIV